MLAGFQSLAKQKHKDVDQIILNYQIMQNIGLDQCTISQELSVSLYCSLIMMIMKMFCKHDIYRYLFTYLYEHIG